uniref:Calmodulin 2 n=1 Tax=Mus musculus TaxID=10090 RepID=A0A571BE58_MOUSE
MRSWGRRRRISPSGASESSGCLVASRKPVALAAWLTN